MKLASSDPWLICGSMSKCVATCGKPKVTWNENRDLYWAKDVVVHQKPIHFK